MLAQNPDDYGNLAVVFTRTAACTSHSADVERLLSLYNQLKTSDRSSLSNETVSHCLYVNLNMPVLAEEYRWKQHPNRTVEPRKAKRQEWFLKTFSEASDKVKEKEENVKKPGQLQRKF